MSKANNLKDSFECLIGSFGKPNVLMKFLMKNCFPMSLKEYKKYFKYDDKAYNERNE